MRQAIAAGVLLLGVGCRTGHSPAVCLSDSERVATGWDAAEALFRGDPSWRGADMATSVDLGAGRILWLFGDSFIAPRGDRSRAGAPFAHNTVAIQHGYDPSQATIDFHYRRGSDGTPSDFFAADAPDTQLWFGDGARLGDVVFLFLSRIKIEAGGGAFGFSSDIPEARLVLNPDDDPSSWNVVPVAVPPNPWNVFLSEGAVYVEGGYVYALSPLDPGNHDVYAARWPVAAVGAGDLDDPQWASAPDSWTRQSAMTDPPMRVFDKGHTEFTIFYDARTSQYVQIQATGFPGDLMMRTAPALMGPWSPQRAIYHPPEADCAGVITYAGKAHPELRAVALGDGQVALSYASNQIDDFAALVEDQNLYFPRFVRLDVVTGVVTP